ncbi:hypothetical protein POM88_044666 [Heracleum sosnowskyi]|uniref:Uncharacterized protein n=1 Tax=Heracleum sosnowskyi TaxID=360622 RepID=A0AAD8H5X9_9APIA|nr:hypothetical protein POM88_044666 [Heracleum sosnowskyi]
MIWRECLLFCVIVCVSLRELHATFHSPNSNSNTEIKKFGSPKSALAHNQATPSSHEDSHYSNVSFEPSKEDISTKRKTLIPLSEVDDARCEWCGIVYAGEYRANTRKSCRLSADAAKEEMVKNGGKRVEALNTHG